MLRSLILIAAFSTIKGEDSGCIPKSFGEDRIVCVCNSTYCDTIDEAELQEGEYQYYTSTMSGERMNFSVANFTTEPENPQVLLIDSNERFQNIHGFGGAMTDATALNLMTLSNATQYMLLEAYFASNGIRYTHCRIPIAGTDFSTRPYTYDDVPNDLTLSHFSLVKEDSYKIDYLHKIKSVMNDSDSLRIFTASWSAPAWMKYTNNITHGSLKHEYYQLYANYTKKFFDAYKERGIDIWGMTPGNEPLDGLVPNFTFNAMLWTPTAEANWSINYLSPTLNKAGYTNLVYMAMDDQRYELTWYVDIMFENKTVRELFKGIAVHWYGDLLSSVTKFTKTHDKYPNKFLLMTEACTGSFSFDKEKVILGSWERGEAYLLSIIEDLSHWVTGWVDWNMALNRHGGPNWAKNYVDSPIITIPESDEFYKQPMFYALAHVSRFVPRGSYKISSTGIDNRHIKTVSFLTPERKVVTVILNKSDDQYNITIKDKTTNSTMNIYLPPRSFQTILYLQSQ